MNTIICGNIDERDFYEVCEAITQSKFNPKSLFSGNIVSTNSLIIKLSLYLNIEKYFLNHESYDFDHLPSFSDYGDVPENLTPDSLIAIINTFYPNSYDGTIKMIKEALDSEKKVFIHYIHKEHIESPSEQTDNAPIKNPLKNFLTVFKAIQRSDLLYEEKYEKIQELMKKHNIKEIHLKDPREN